MNLIIVASLSEPPTESLPFRHITLSAHDQLKLDCLIEVEQQVKDLYYKYLLHKGLLDFVEQLITPPENEKGIRLDTELNYPLTIKLKSITFQNCLNILGQINFLKSIPW